MIGRFEVDPTHISSPGRGLHHNITQLEMAAKATARNLLAAEDQHLNEWVRLVRETATNPMHSAFREQTEELKTSCTEWQNNVNVAMLIDYIYNTRNNRPTQFEEFLAARRAANYPPPGHLPQAPAQMAQMASISSSQYRQQQVTPQASERRGSDEWWKAQLISFADSGISLKEFAKRIQVNGYLMQNILNARDSPHIFNSLPDDTKTTIAKSHYLWPNAILPASTAATTFAGHAPGGQGRRGPK
ncbi:hypothetical protein F8271_08440 [Micromonospora sp. ALFpr18c]|uniref:hypothetical protein n=1 Tax=Micromonospora sp. ALFpr18c TaxID=1458665 RepID=UPI00124AFF3E|nr:hypothetical protein [Micromonospora sp. ALFpr18c]KAB1945429.1 hypothetical protein F8271_08440 [Micromonospora sp. ALFpr18c]